MTTTPPQIELRWRDENYGRVAASAAFRNYAGTSDWSDATLKKFRTCLQRTGFAFNQQRCSYICSTGIRDERKSALCHELKAASFHIIHGDITTATD